jgi:outer membrane beta-barrel protein
LLTAFWALLVASPARAADPPAPGKARRPSDEPPPPSCLDQSITDELGEQLRPRGVQKRPFLKDQRFQLVARGGLHASDLMSSSYQYGGALAWYLAEDFGLETGVDLSPVAVDLDEPLSDFFGNRRFEASTGVLATAGLIWSPVHWKAKTAGGGLVHGDGALVLSGGRLFHDTAQGLAFSAGLAVDLYAWKYLSFRFEVRDLVLVQEALGETRLTNNLLATLGVGVWLPRLW